jgi:hypothetical protein
MSVASAASVVGVPALAGAFIGSKGQQSSGTSSSGVNLVPMTSLGNYAGADTMSALGNYQNLTSYGAGASQVSGALSSQTNLANMYNQYAQSGGLPNQQQIGQANQYAQNIFAPQQTALQQSFIGAQANEQQQAGILGRSVADPVLQAKLQLGYMQQQQQLSAQQGSFANQMALQLPQNQLAYATQGNQLQQQLAGQAFQNQYNMAGLGQGILQSQQGYQLSSSGHYGNLSSQSGGGLAGALSGAMSGFSGGANLAMSPGFQNFFGGGGAAATSGGQMGAMLAPV